ncbi:hypothetical protein H0H81_004020 [Sphagnurus paluster]|uniref:3'-5' exonuclease domain-containing protein n=1 Tax=Sphagnurus paluster TaxID=117069 RepID=A0A9P7GTK5_9AGAR|nr:hypothetical protein H0H81_004020 [Sphagnurus paluster]
MPAPPRSIGIPNIQPNTDKAKGTVDAEKTFLIDALRLPDRALKPIFALLQSPTTVKFMFDGRMDYSALFHQHNVRLRRVIDLQLAHVHKRALRTQVQRLVGMRACATHNGVYIAGASGQVDHTTWLDRPLPAKNLSYASTDVLTICQLAFKVPLYTDVEADSMRYISIWSDAPPVEGDKYRSNVFLPLAIMDFKDGQSVAKCKSCKRALPLGCFSQPANSSNMQCFVCQAVDGKDFGESNQLGKSAQRVNGYEGQGMGNQSRFRMLDDYYEELMERQIFGY